MKDKTLHSFLAVWLLFHEVADEWIKELIAGGRTAGPDGPVAADLAARVADEKDRIRAMMKDFPGSTPGSGESVVAADRGHEREENERRFSELESRIVMLERDLARLRGPRD